MEHESALPAKPPAFLEAVRAFDRADSAAAKAAAVMDMLKAREILYGPIHHDDVEDVREAFAQQKSAITEGLKDVSEETLVVAEIVGKGIDAQNLIRKSPEQYERKAHLIIGDYLAPGVAQDFVAAAKMTLDFIADRHVNISAPAARIRRDTAERLGVLRQTGDFPEPVGSGPRASKKHSSALKH